MKESLISIIYKKKLVNFVKIYRIIILFLKYSKRVMSLNCRVMSDAAIRSKFVDNVVQFVKKYKFDGFDLDWEYPAKRGGHPEDVANLVSVLKDLKERFVEENLILSIAVGAAEMTASVSYDIPNLSKYVDFINLMTYDFHGSFDTDHKIGHHAPLYASSTETGEKRKMNIVSRKLFTNRFFLFSI